MDKYKGFDPPSKHPDQLIELPPPTSSNPNLKVEYSKDRHFAQQLGDLTKEQIRQDLEAMGFTKERTEEMFSREETIVDGFAQLPNYSQGFVHKDPAKRPRPRNDNDKKLVGNMKKTAYKHLVIDDRYPNWVLFDVDIAMNAFGKQSLSPLFMKWLCFYPGNDHIVKYNIRSGCFGLQWVPAHFDGCAVEYTQNGPVLVPFEHHATGPRKSVRAQPRIKYTQEYSDDSLTEAQRFDGEHSPVDYGAGFKDVTGQHTEILQMSHTHSPKRELSAKRLQEDDLDVSIESSKRPRLYVKSTASDRTLAHAAQTGRSPDNNPPNDIEVAARKPKRGRLVQKKNLKTGQHAREEVIPRGSRKMEVRREWAFLDRKPPGAPFRWRPLEDEINVVAL